MSITYTARQNQAAQMGRAVPDSLSVGGQANSGQMELAGAIDPNVGIIDNNPDNVTEAFSSPTLRAGLGIEDPIAPEEAEKTKEAETAQTTRRRIDSIKYMLESDMTLEDFKAQHPEKYDVISEGYEDDDIIHEIAKRSREVYSKDSKEADKATRERLERLGYDMNKLDERASLYNRISNGTALTIAQAGAGLNEFLSFLPESMRPSMAEHYEKILSEVSEADSELYKSLKPISRYGDGEVDTMDRVLTAISGSGGYSLPPVSGENPETVKPSDAGTAVGRGLPLAAGGFAGGSGKVGLLLADIVPNLLVIAGDPKSTDADKALSVLSSVGGYKLANSLSKWTKKSYKSVEEFEEAVRKEPHLIDNLQKTMKDRGIDPKDIKAFDRPDSVGSASLEDAYQRVEKIPTTRKEFDATLDARVEEELKVLSARQGKMTPKKTREFKESIRAKVTDEAYKAYSKQLPVTIATQSKNADDFLVNVAKYSEVLNDAGLNSLVEWAKNTQKLSGGARADAITSAGLNGLMLASGNPAIAKVFPSVLKNWVTKLGSQAVNKTKGALTKPRTGPIEATKKLLQEG